MNFQDTRDHSRVVFEFLKYFTILKLGEVDIRQPVLICDFFSQKQTLQKNGRLKHHNWSDLAVGEFHRNFGQLIGVLLLHKLPVIGVQLAFRQVQALDSVRRVLQMHQCTLLCTQQFKTRAVDLVVAVFRVSQVIVFMSAVTVSHSNAPIAWKNKFPRLAVDISTVKTANEYLENSIKFNRLYEQLNVTNCEHFHFATLHVIVVHVIIKYRFWVDTLTTEQCLHGIHG